MDKRLVRAGAAQSTCEDIRALRRKLSHNPVSCNTYAALLRLYGEHRALSEGYLLHARILLDGVHPHELSFLQNLLIQMYGRCGAMADTFSTFFHIHHTDHFSWNLLLGACSQNARHAEALNVFNQMQIEGFLPNKHAFQSLLAIFASQNSIWACKAIHAYINGSGCVPDLVLESAIVNMYGKCKSVKDAREMFDRMPQKNVFCWNAMMTTYAQLCQSANALLLFREMLLIGVAPSKVTFVSLLDACTSLVSSDMAKLMLFCVVDGGFDSDIVVGTAVINLFGKCGNLEEALQMFYGLPGKGVVTWNMMIEVSASHGKSQQAFHLFKEMVVANVTPNSSTFVSILSACANQENLVEGKFVHFVILTRGTTCGLVLETALISMYGKCGSLRDAQVIFGNMCVCDDVAWTSMMAAYIQHGQGREAISLIQKMPPGTSLDSITFITILNACATEGALEAGRMMHAVVLHGDYASDMPVVTAVVNMYSKCGKLEDAQVTFETLPQRDLVAWNAMIAAYAQHAQFGAVVKLVRHMLRQGIVPDEISFICILTALSHVGMVADAELCFHSMTSFFGIIAAADHYNVLLDLFARAGWVHEGERLILNLPFQPSASSWMTLLSACRMHLNVPGGERAVRHAYELEPDFAAPYVVLANVYSISDQFDEVE